MRLPNARSSRCDSTPSFTKEEEAQEGGAGAVTVLLLKINEITAAFCVPSR